MDGAKTQWKLPNSYHVTQLFIGGNKNKTQSKVYQSFQEGQNVKVSIKGVLYVPGCILTGICFPQAPIDNKFPHMTLMLGNKWTAKLSNDVL